MQLMAHNTGHRYKFSKVGSPFNLLYTMAVNMTLETSYGVAIVSSIDKIIGLFCRL